VHVGFDGGRLTSDAGILSAVEQRLTLLIAAGYPDGNDCDALRFDPAFKMAVGRLPESGEDLCSQPTISRFENLRARPRSSA
jgi:DDE family transposase